MVRDTQCDLAERERDNGPNQPFARREVFPACSLVHETCLRAADIMQAPVFTFPAGSLDPRPAHDDVDSEIRDDSRAPTAMRLRSPSS